MAGTSFTRKRLIVTGAVALALGAGAIVGVPALLASAEAETGAEESPRPAAGPRATPVPEPTPGEVDWDSLTEEEEMAMADAQTSRNQAITAVQETFPDDYAYGYITDDGFGMSFKGSAPPAALAILDAVGDPYELHENVGFTELDVQAMVPRVAELVGDAVGDQSFSAGANVFTVTVEVEIYPDSGTQNDHTVLEGAALEKLIDDIRPVLYPGFDIRFTSLPGAGIGW